ERRGVRFDGPTEEIPGIVKLASLFDPDNNRLMLYESLGDQD
ncbi:MAG: VOC family protein, partial [Planctomycetes bacterium]|nr:VOC family protein [Planctomycetota bacterium]